METQLDPIFQKAVDEGRLPGVAGLVLDVKGNSLFSKGYGRIHLDDESSPAVTPDTPCLIFSCTKLITCIAALQLMEVGKLDLNDPVENYLPHFSDIELLKGFDDQGQPRLRRPSEKPTILHLLTHTAGFGYDMFDAQTRKYREAVGQETSMYVLRSSRQEYTTPLVFEPGERYEYSPSIDWLGQVIEKISGLRVDKFCKEHIFDPLELKVTGPQLAPDLESQFMVVYDKDRDGKLEPDAALRPATDPEVMPGGHFAYSTCREFCQILLTLLNRGTHPLLGARVLEPETVAEYVFTDFIPRVGCSNKGIGAFPALVDTVSIEAEFLPGVSKGWSAGLMINNEDTKNGRLAGSGAWAGVANSYFWIDPQSGILGFLTSAVMPFMDRDILHLADAMERAAYGRTMAGEVGEPGCNFAGGVRGMSFVGNY